MIKREDMVLYKNIGTYQLVIEHHDGEFRPEKHYEVRHFSGLDVQASTIKECQKCLDDMEVTAQEIREAINKLAIYGYRVFKEQEFKDTSADPNGLDAYSQNYVIL